MSTVLPWKPTDYDMTDNERSAYGFVSLLGPLHPDAPEGTPWKGYCSMVATKEQLRGWFATDAEAIAAVETFVLANAVSTT